MTDPTRLSSLEFLILKMLVNGNSGEMFGLEMVVQSGGRLKRGTIYVTLGRMEDKGLILSRKEKRREGARGLPRRLYKPSAKGRRVLAAWEMPIGDYVESIT